MGKIKKILENELAGGTQTTDVYPVTSTKAVYDENNKRLDEILSESTEAIYMSYTSGEIDEVAKSIVDGFHGSKRHWAYLGNVDHEYEELKYVAVGLTYNKGFWYCAIWMDSEQHTGPVYFD